MSLGLRLTLRFALAMILVAWSLTIVHIQQVERAIRSDAVILLWLEAGELARAIERDAGDAPTRGDLARVVDREAGAAYENLRLAVRVLDAQGRVALARGAFSEYEVPVPDLPTGDRSWRVLERDLGGGVPYVSLLGPAGDGHVEVMMHGSPFVRSALDIRRRVLMTLLAAVALIPMLGWLLARSSLQPIRDMIAAARRVRVSQLDERIPESGRGDELDQLARSLNEMMDRIRDGFDRLRSFSANAAHQLRTPVSRLRNRLEEAQAAPRDAGADARLIRDLLRDTERIGEAVDGMLRLARAEGTRRDALRARVDLAQRVEAVVAFFEPLASENGILLEIVERGPVGVLGDEELLHELFSTLVDNALRHTSSGGRVELAVRREDDEAVVSVTDFGPGIEAAELPHLFDRFHRGAQGGTQEGLGLGLALARQIALQHDGRIEVASEKGRGATFTVRLPVAPPTEPS